MLEKTPKSSPTPIIKSSCQPSHYSLIVQHYHHLMAAAPHITHAMCQSLCTKNRCMHTELPAVRQAGRKGEGRGDALL